MERGLVDDVLLAAWMVLRRAVERKNLTEIPGPK